MKYHDRRSLIDANLAPFGVYGHKRDCENCDNKLRLAACSRCDNIGFKGGKEIL